MKKILIIYVYFTYNEPTVPKFAQDLVDSVEEWLEKIMKRDKKDEAPMLKREYQLINAIEVTVTEELEKWIDNQ